MGISVVNPDREVYFSRDLKGRWEQFKDSAKRKLTFQINKPISTNFTPTGETQFHIAVAYGEAKFLRFLLSKLKEDNRGMGWATSGLGMRNEDGNTPLHLAASVGDLDMCDCIAKVDPVLLDIRNNAGETPLFSAALRGKQDAFLLLHTVVSTHITGNQLYSFYRRTVDGDTILHSAISGEYFDLAYEIIQLCEDLVWYVNERGETPLQILARKPSAFSSGSSNLGIWKRIIYRGLSVKNLEPNRPYVPYSHIPENDRSGFNFIGLLMKFRGQVENCFKKHAAADAQADTESLAAPKPVAVRKRQTGAFRNPYKAIEILFGIFGTIARIRKEKEKHVWARQIMKELLSFEKIYEQDSGACPMPKSAFENYEKEFDLPNPYDDTFSGRNIVKATNERAFFVAARHGITEMVKEVLKNDSLAVDYVNQDRKNILLLAIENRLTDVIEIVLDKCSLRPSALVAVDVNGNSALHLAATLQENNPWPVPGATLQMQWEIKWFKFIKDVFSGYSLLRYNEEGKTPEDLFAETHKELVKNNIMWLNNTSQACSVVAGLFVTIAFTTSTTVPGGARQETGTPYLENEPAFELFAISSQVAFYSSIFAVVVFLAILTSGYQMSEFDKALPRKLLLGLTALYVSIASMLMSFCSARFFILKAKLKHAASPVYIATGLVVTLFAVVQFPLYFQLVWATFKNVPQRRSMRAIPEYLFF